MSFQSFPHFLGFYLNGKMVYTRVHADWASGAEVALAWRLRGACVDDDVADRLGLKWPGRSRPSDQNPTATMDLCFFFLAGNGRKQSAAALLAGDLVGARPSD